MTFNKVIVLVTLGLISICVFLVGFMPKENHNPKVVYQVYLNGDKIGLINSKEKLETYINQKQTELKNQYHVDKVYVPEGLEIKKVITYSNDVSSAKEIYGKIKDLDSFTIKGYVITIKGEDTQKIYVTNKQVFEEAVDTTVKAFVDDEGFAKYLASKQANIADTGTIIEDVTINQDINVRKDYVPTNKKIYTAVEELTKYILYGSTKTQATYTVKDGDTIEDIAFNHKLSTEEFLVANPEFSSADVLLIEGQTVNVGLINPQIDVVETSYVVADQPKKYNTEFVYDKKMYAGITKVKQKGSNGLNRVTQRITQTNGDTTEVAILGTQELVPAINEVVIIGEKYVSNVGISGYWYWPTTSPYIITSNFGYRWGDFHAGVDISGCGYGSPIYAANNGVVEFAAYYSTLGRYVLINHNNGYYTQYAHLSKISVKVGQTVARGQVIGGMGNSGRVYGTTGVHLHFGMWRGEPYNGGVALNPLKAY